MWLQMENFHSFFFMAGCSSIIYMGFPHSSVSKESACNAGDLDSNSGSRRSPGEGNGNLLQHTCLENPMGRGACVYRCIYIYIYIYTHIFFIHSSVDGHLVLFCVLATVNKTSMIIGMNVSFQISRDIYIYFLIYT